VKILQTAPSPRRVISFPVAAQINSCWHLKHVFLDHLNCVSLEYTYKSLFLRTIEGTFGAVGGQI
jgi:hypothetical protein